MERTSSCIWVNTDFLWGWLFCRRVPQIYDWCRRCHWTIQGFMQGEANQSKITSFFNKSSVPRVMQYTLYIHNHSFQPGTTAPFQYTPTQISSCLLIMNLHTIMFCVLWSSYPRFSNKVLNSCTVILPLTDFQEYRHENSKGLLYIEQTLV